LKHLATNNVAKSGLFDNLRCYVDFEAAVVAYGKLFDDEL